MLNNLKNESGFSLMELLVAVAIIGIVSTGIYKVFDVQNRVFAGEQKVTHNLANARVIVDILSSFVRLIGYDPQETGISTFGLKDSTESFTNTSMTSNTSLFFTKDANEDGTLNLDTGERVGLKFDSANNILQYAITDSTTGAITWINKWHNITAFSLSYIYEDGTSSTGTANLPSDSVTNHTYDKVMAIVIDITTRSESVHNLTMAYDTETISSTVLLRNRPIAN